MDDPERRGELFGLKNVSDRSPRSHVEPILRSLTSSYLPPPTSHSSSFLRERMGSLRPISTTESSKPNSSVVPSRRTKRTVKLELSSFVLFFCLSLHAFFEKQKLTTLPLRRIFRGTGDSWRTTSSLCSTPSTDSTTLPKDDFPIQRFSRSSLRLVGPPSAFPTASDLDLTLRCPLFDQERRTFMREMRLLGRPMLRRRFSSRRRLSGERSFVSLFPSFPRPLIDPAHPLLLRKSNPAKASHIRGESPFSHSSSKLELVSRKETDLYVSVQQPTIFLTTGREVHRPESRLERLGERMDRTRRS